MPCGRRPDPHGAATIDFDAIYEHVLRPAIEDVGLEPLRGDVAPAGGLLPGAVLDRLLLCELAIVDLTFGGAPVLYALGMRNAVREPTTLTLCAEGHLPGLDLGRLGGLVYRPGDALDEGAARVLRGEVRAGLEARVRAHAERVEPSRVLELVTTLEPPDIDRLRTDVFRDRLQYSPATRQALACARAARDRPALDALRATLLGRADEELGALADLLVSYRAIEAWDAMVELHEALPPVLRRTRMLREQHGFALNRLGRRDEALAVLEGVIAELGPSSETSSLVGRVHKDRWLDAQREGDELAARECLRQAIASYRAGFQADPRDPFPGINALTLLELEGDPEGLRQQARLLPVVRYAVERRLAAKVAVDYWDHATLLELAVLGRDEQAAALHLRDALALVREPWEPKTTAGNLRMIRDAREAASTPTAWIDAIVAALEQRGA